MTKRSDIASEYSGFVQEIQKNKDTEKQVLCVIFGIEKFLSEISDFEETIKQASKHKNYSFIIVDSLARFKNYEYEDWFKDNFTGDSGIWIGKGIQDQYLINYTMNSNQLDNNCRNSFGYSIFNGDVLMVKLLGMEG